MADEKSDLVLDAEVIFSALIRSTQLRQALGTIADEVAQEATTLANAVARDDGVYASAFRAFTASATELRQFANAREGSNRDRGAGVNRRRRGQRGTNRYLDWEVKGDPDDGKYNGEVGVVINTAKTANFVEFGSLAKGPRRVLWNSAEVVAQRYDLEAIPLYDNFHEQDTATLSEKQRAGHEKAAIARNYWPRSSVPKESGQ